MQQLLHTSQFPFISAERELEIIDFYLGAVCAGGERSG
jgi:hypothetical protein